MDLGGVWVWGGTLTLALVNIGGDPVILLSARFISLRYTPEDPAGIGPVRLLLCRSTCSRSSSAVRRLGGAGP